MYLYIQNELLKIVEMVAATLAKHFRISNWDFKQSKNPALSSLKLRDPVCIDCSVEFFRRDYL
jgi:hypothetical protein